LKTECEAKKEVMRARYQRAVSLFDKETAQRILFNYLIGKLLFDENVKFTAEINPAATVCKHYH